MIHMTGGGGCWWLQQWQWGGMQDNAQPWFWVADSWQWTQQQCWHIHHHGAWYMIGWWQSLWQLQEMKVKDKDVKRWASMTSPASDTATQRWCGVQRRWQLSMHLHNPVNNFTFNHKLINKSYVIYYHPCTINPLHCTYLIHWLSVPWW